MVQAAVKTGFDTASPAEGDVQTAPARALSPILGDAASATAVNRLRGALKSVKAGAAQAQLNGALKAIKGFDWGGAAKCALRAVDLDPRSGYGWYLLAIALEKRAEFGPSLRAYEAALKLLPDDVALANDLGRLAHRLGQFETAEKLLHIFLLKNPGHPEAVNNLACVLRELHRYDEAIAVLQPVIYADPTQAALWNVVGTVLSDRGDLEQSLTFFDEALRAQPDFLKARYNRGNVRQMLGDAVGGLEDIEAALTDKELPSSDRTMMRFARAVLLIASGDLARGWPAYGARLEREYAGAAIFQIDRPRWRPGDDLAGKRLLVVGEQGLGDEVMFANLLPDVVGELGGEQALHLAVEQRLVPLFQRSFPGATVSAHHTRMIDARKVRWAPAADLDQIDLWAPMGALLEQFRPEVAAFPSRPRYLTPDPAAVARWRAEVEALGAGPKVGLLWKSLSLAGARRRFFSAFDAWRPVLKTPGAVFVNLQYGDCSEELEQARAEGVEIWDPPGIDLKQDLDEVAALCCAMDLVIGAANATTNLAGACGAPLWLISTPGAWPSLGTAAYPWYPQARVFRPRTLNDWDPVMAEVADALAGRVAAA